MNNNSSNALKGNKKILLKTQSHKFRIIAAILTITILSNLLQVNIFAQEKNNEVEANISNQETYIEYAGVTNEEPTNEEPTNEESFDEVVEDVSNDQLTNVADLQTQEPVTYSFASLAQVSDRYRITYYSNYPEGLGLANAVYTDPIIYENNALANASFLTQAGFALPENYYFVGWHPAANAGTAQYYEGESLGEIDNNWNLYAIYMPYKTMEWTIKDSSYISDYNAQSHTNLISWPTAQSADWAGDVISGLTYTYSVNGGVFSSTKPSFVDAGNYTVTVKASAPRYKETTTTVNVTINKAPLKIYPDISGSYEFESLTGIPYGLPAVNVINGPKSQSDESAINNVIAASVPLFNVIDSNSNVVIDLKTALPGQYSVQINSNALANLQNNAALRNYILSADSGNFIITSLNTLTVTAKPLNTVYNSQYHSAIYGVTSNVANAKIEYSIDNSAFSTEIPQVKNANSYKVEIRASAPGYNSATIELTATVEKRDATLNIAMHSKTSGTNDPAFAASFSGLQGNDTIAYTLKRTAGEAVGSYVITANVTNDNNYNVVVNNGLLTITPAPVVPTNPEDTTQEPETEIEVETDTESETIQALDFTSNAAEEITELDSQGLSAEAQNELQVNIGDSELPLSKADSSWALLNLILLILTTIISLVLLIGYFTEKRKYSEDNEEQIKRKGFVRFTSIIIAVVSIIVFILTQNMQLKMVFVDRWSIIMIVLTITQIVVGILAKKAITDKKVV